MEGNFLTPRRQISNQETSRLCISHRKRLRVGSRGSCTQRLPGKAFQEHWREVAGRLAGPAGPRNGLRSRKSGSKLSHCWESDCPSLGLSFLFCKIKGLKLDSKIGTTARTQALKSTALTFNPGLNRDWAVFPSVAQCPHQQERGQRWPVCRA